MLGGIALLVLGAGGAYFAYTRYLADMGPVALTPAASAPIFVDHSDEISGTGPELVEAIRESLRRPLESGAVRFLYRSVLLEESVFNALALPAPDMLLRNIAAEGSMAGIVSTPGGSGSSEQSPFFILSVASYTDTFAALLSWERDMPRDLSALFEPASSVTPGPAPTLLSALNASLFRDEVVANHDARVYRDRAGREQLVYGYWSPGVLVIARDRRAFVEILSRLASARRR